MATLGARATPVLVALAALAALAGLVQEWMLGRWVCRCKHPRATASSETVVVVVVVVVAVVRFARNKVRAASVGSPRFGPAAAG
jgi:hypothetical protein